MPVVKLRANLGSNDFPAPLCEFRDGEEHEVSDQWAAKLVGHGLAVVVLTPPRSEAVRVTSPIPAVESVIAEPQDQEPAAIVATHTADDTQDQGPPPEPMRQSNRNKPSKEK